MNLKLNGIEKICGVTCLICITIAIGSLIIASISSYLSGCQTLFCNIDERIQTYIALFYLIGISSGGIAYISISTRERLRNSEIID